MEIIKIITVSRIIDNRPSRIHDKYFLCKVVAPTLSMRFKEGVKINNAVSGLSDFIFVTCE